MLQHERDQWRMGTSKIARPPGGTAGQVTLEAVRRATYRKNTNAEPGWIFPLRPREQSEVHRRAAAKDRQCRYRCWRGTGWDRAGAGLVAEDGGRGFLSSRACALLSCPPVLPGKNPAE